MNQRKTEYKTHEIFVNRWSPRAMSTEEVSKDELMSLFEAARWAPSAYNSQPWRFIYAKKGTQLWNTLFNLLVEFNQSWIKNATYLVLIISRKTFEHNNKPSITHSFDTGSAWQNIALQGSINNLVIHAMSGFDYEKARSILKIPSDYNIEAMFVVGKPGKKEDLPNELQEREFPSDRKKISEFVFEGEFRGGN